MQIHHIGYLVKDIENAKKLYSNLGYKIISDIFYDNIRDIYISFMVKDGYLIELVSPASKDSVVYGLLKKTGPMPYHICYESNNINSDLEYLTGEEGGGFMVIDSDKHVPAIPDGNYNAVFLYNNTVGIIELIYKNE